MNEKIKELAEQAGFYIDSAPIISNSNNPRLEKFAELIVKECLKVVDTRYNGLSDKDSIRLFKMIEDHMGMKIDMRYTEAEHKYFADLAEKYEQD